MAGVSRAIAVLICFPALGLGQSPVRAGLAPAVRLPFGPSTPADLKAIWFDFHATRLCQDIDAVFVYGERGLEIWCLSGNERSLDRLKRMTAPLLRSYRVDLYVTRPQPELDKPEEKGPPPGLWNNQELRGYLGNPGPELTDVEGRSRTGLDDELFTLKYRIQMFADQTLELGERLGRYGLDLQELAAVAFDPGFEPADRARARVLCLAHATGASETVSKLDQNLRRALPPSGRRAASEESADVAPPSISPGDLTAEIARESRKLAHRTRRFIYPDQFTVGVEDLLEPGLLESLATLRRLTFDLQRRLKEN